MQHNTRDKDWNQEWILEPVIRDFELGAFYAVQKSQEENYDYSKYVNAYPKFDKDCTNFISQCLLASGIHYEGDWLMYRKNNTYNTPTSNWQTNWSWDTTIPGPWMSVPDFKEFLKTKVSKGYRAKGSLILENPSIVWNLGLDKGTVVQIAYNEEGSIGKPFHSMIISDYYNNGSDSTYLLTYHSKNSKNVNLIDICAQYPDEYFLFNAF